MVVAGFVAITSRATGAAAQPTPTATDTFEYRSDSDTVIDGGLMVGFPTALPTGMSRGVGAGITWGRFLNWGARASWMSVTESSTAWIVKDSELRFRVTGAVQHTAGRGTLALRLGMGGTLVHESRVRSQGERAGLMGDELSTSVYAMLPAADLDVVVSVHIKGPWLLVLSGGPSVALLDGDVHPGWTAQLGIAWQP